MDAVPLDHDRLAAAVSEGGLPNERHWIDFKAGLYPRDPVEAARAPSKTERRKAHMELARDAASMALRGGFLVYGVSENDDGFSFTPTGMLLEPGVRETVIQVVGSLVTPSLEVLAHILASDDDPGTGFLVVEVPESPDAPHMSDGRYYGRSDTGRTVLPEAEVERLVLERRRRITLLDEQMTLTSEHSPALGSLATGPVALMTAVPTRGWRDMFDAYTEIPFSQPFLEAQNLATSAAEHDWPDQLGPNETLHQLLFARRSVSIGGTWRRNWEHAGEGDSYRRQALGISADGPIRFQAFPVGDPLDARQAQTVVFNEQPRGEGAVRGVLAESHLLRQLLTVLHLLKQLSSTAQYSGSWHIGLEVRDLRGYVSEAQRHQLSTTPTARLQILDADAHREMTRVSATQLTDNPSAVLGRLVGRLLLGLDRRLHLPHGLR